MKKMLAVMLTAALGLSLVACGDKGGAQSNKDGNTIALAKENDVISMNTMYATDGMSFEVIHATIDGLMDQDKDGKIINSLAESHTETEDGLVYTFKIRENANWSNGDPVTAADFVYAWSEALTSPDAEYAYLYTAGNASLLNADAIMAGEKDKSELGVKAIDAKTLEVTLSQKTPYFLSLMTFPVFYPVNQKFAEEQGDQYALIPEKMLACGPYVMKTWEKGTKIILEKNDTYWDAANVKTDTLVINITPEVASSVTAFESGGVDFTRVSSDLIDGYKDNAAFTQVLEGYLWYLQPNLNNENMANKNLRLALAYAIDKEDLVNNVLKDGSIAGNGFVPSKLATGPDGKDFRTTGGEFHNYDLTKAQEYLEKAKTELGKSEITISLLYENADPAKTVAEYLQAMLTQNLPGLTVEMDMQTKDARIEKQKVRDYEVCLTRWGPDYADPTTYLNMMITGNAYNYGDYSSEAFDSLMLEAGTNPDIAARWSQLIDAEKVLMEDMPVIAVFQVGGASLIREGVTGIESHAVGVPYIYKNLAK